MKISPILALSDEAIVNSFNNEALVIYAHEQSFVFSKNETLLCNLIKLLDERSYTEEEIVNKAIEKRGSMIHLAEAYYCINYLRSKNLIDFIIGNSEASILIEFANHYTTYKEWLEATQSDLLILSRFALMRKQNKYFLWETPLSAIRIKTMHQSVVDLLLQFVSPQSFAEVLQNTRLDKGLAVRILTAFKEANILLNEAQEAKPIFEQWQFHDLLFHARSRLGRTKEPLGGLYPFIGKIPPLPALKEYNNHETIQLSCPKSEDIKKSFLDLVASRRSCYPGVQNVLNATELGFFLYHCARVVYETSYTHYGVQVDTAGRPYPSAGGLYELEIYPLVKHCIDLEKGLYHYNPKQHSITPLPTLPENLDKTISFIDQASKGSQVLLMITARFPRLAWKYRSCAYALMLKDVGVLIAYMYLFAEYYGLSGCAIGCGNADLFASMANINYYDEPYVGDFLLGKKDT